MQIMLQLLIASTGNYTFFNLLTAGLAAGCWEGRDWRQLGKRWKAVDILETLAAYLFLAWCTDQMFSLGTYSRGPVNVAESSVSDLLRMMVVKLNVDPGDVDLLCELVVPAAMAWSVGFCVVVGAKDAWFAVKGGRRAGAAGVGVCTALVAAVMCGLGVPMYTLTNGLRGAYLGGGAVDSAGVAIR
jgi:hypothetical protein